MSYVVLVLLSLLWLGFFLPSLLQARRSSPLASASTFQDSLTRISTGRAVEMDADTAHRAAAARRRRSRKELARQRDILAGLTAAALASMVLAVAFGGAARWLVVPCVAALGGYVALLRVHAVRTSTLRRRPPASTRPPAATPAVPAAEARPVPADDGVVPSVRRRVTTPDLERIAG